MQKKYRVLFLFFLLVGRLNAQTPILTTLSESSSEITVSNLKQDKSTMIALIFGQSNAANYGQTPYTPKDSLSIFNFFDSNLSIAKDPLKGATGSKGSVWTHLADTLISGGYYDKVILVPIAVGGSSIECWSSGNCSKKLIETLALLDNQNIKLTHIFWHQGETDNLLDTPKEVYNNRMKSILNTIKYYNQDAPIYISLASYHPSAIKKPFGVDENIREAQRNLIDENNGVLLGPDTDTLIHAIHRYDGVHFSEYGLKSYAKLWLDAIVNSREKAR